MIGRFNMGKQIGTPSMSKKKSSTGSYPPVVVSSKFSSIKTPSIKTPSIKAPKVKMSKMQVPRLKKGF